MLGVVYFDLPASGCCTLKTLVTGQNLYFQFFCAKKLKKCKKKVCSKIFDKNCFFKFAPKSCRSVFFFVSIKNYIFCTFNWIVNEKVVLALKIDFNQRTACGAPVRWSKYTTRPVRWSKYTTQCFVGCTLCIVTFI